MTAIPQDLTALCAKGAPAKHYFSLTTGETLVVRTSQLREIRRIKPLATAALDEAAPALLEFFETTRDFARKAADEANLLDRRRVSRSAKRLGKEPSRFALAQHERMHVQTERVCATRLANVSRMVAPPSTHPRLVITWETGRLCWGTVQK